MTSLPWQRSLQDRQYHSLCTLGKTNKCWLYQCLSFFIYRSLQQSLHRFTQTRNVDELMKVVLQENGQQTKEVSDDIDSVEPDSDVPDGPPPPPIFSLSRSPLKGTRWKDNEHAKQLLDKMTKPSKSMIGLPWKKVDRLTGAISIVLSKWEVRPSFFSYHFWGLVTMKYFWYF